MALSDYELQVLQRLEIQLQRPKHPWLARVGRVWLAFEAATVVSALAVVMIIAVFTVGAGAAPVAGLLCAVAGYQVAMGRRRLKLREDQPER